MAAAHQVKRQLRQHGEQQQPPGIALFVVGVGTALRNEEAENGEGQTAHGPHPHGVWEQGKAHVVDEHGDHGQQLQVQAIQRQLLVHVVPPAPAAPRSR